MKIFRNITLVVCLTLLGIGFMKVLPAFQPPEVEDGDAKIAWYSTLDAGLEEAKRSNRPILFISGAPQCLGVSGIW